MKRVLFSTLWRRSSSAVRLTHSSKTRAVARSVTFEGTESHTKTKS